MLELKEIEKKPQQIIKRLSLKGYDAEKTVDAVLTHNAKRKEMQASRDKKQAEMNQAAHSIGQLLKEGKQTEADAAKQQTSKLKQDIKELEAVYAEHKRALHEELLKLPNLPHESVPQGKHANDNEIVKQGGKAAKLEGKPHWELAEEYALIDFGLGVKISGAGFPLYKNLGAKLQRALINFFLDRAIEAGYMEVIPPYLVNEASGFGTGQLPDKEGQMYHIVEDNLYLIPTAEVPVTNICRDCVLSEEELPIQYTAYSACFRREAGSYGKDVRGLNRLHQFDKVEIVQITTPETSHSTLDQMVAHVEGLVRELELPYRVLRLCGGDMSFTSALTYDFEVFSAVQGRWLEVSSISNFESYQANRLNLRIRNKKKKSTSLAHTLNGSALALPRIVAALLENNQTAEGINMPKVLRPYCGFDRIEKRP